MIELITKHYDILGERIPIELNLYDNGNGCKVVARHILGYIVSTDAGEDMDQDIISGFESILRSNMKRNKIIVIKVENPDYEDEDSIMVGIQIFN